jgi:cytochrome P450
VSFLGSGIFTTDGAFWQHSRAILRPQFEKSQVSAIEQFEPYVQKLLSCIPSDGTTVDLQDLFHKLTMDTSTDFLTGTGTDCLGGDEQGEKFASTFEKCLQDGIWKDMLGWFYYLTPRKEARDAVKYAHTAVEGWVKQAMEVKSSSELSDEKAKDRGERYVFVNELARHEEVDATRVRDETMNILLAGRDTTASLLSNLWFVLAREPEIYKKLQAEIDELNGQQPSYEALRNMKYIKYAVQESKPVTTLKP